MPSSAKPKRKPKLTPPLKWHGGKHYLAPKIIDLMPPHLHYVEPYFGGGAVLLEKDPFDPRHQWGEKGYEQGISEVVNDLNEELTNFWRVLQGEKSFARFRRIIEVTPFSQVEFQEAETRQDPKKVLDVQAAVAFFIRCRQSRAGGFKDFATLSRNRTRRRMNEQTSAWLNCVDGLPAVNARLIRVAIRCDDATKVIRTEDGDKTLFYLDPPYLPETRASNGNYACEMTEDHHREMLDTITQCSGMVMLSGYPNRLYDTELHDWNRHDFKIDNKVAGGSTKRIMTEAVWCNF